MIAVPKRAWAVRWVRTPHKWTLTAGMSKNEGITPTASISQSKPCANSETCERLIARSDFTGLLWVRPHSLGPVIIGHGPLSYC